MRSVLFLLILMFQSLSSDAVTPGDYAIYKGALNGKEYSLYRTEVLSFDPETSLVKYLVTEILTDGTRIETIKTEKALTDNQGAYIENNCENYGERIDFRLNDQVIPSCRLRDMNTPEFYIDVAKVPFGFVFFNDPDDGSHLELVDMLYH